MKEKDGTKDEKFQWGNQPNRGLDNRPDEEVIKYLIADGYTREGAQRLLRERKRQRGKSR